MFRCPKCKQWLKNIMTDFDVKYDGNSIHAIHVPAKICSKCGEITVHGIIQDRIIQYASQKNKTCIDYAECENEESVASQSIF